MAENKGEKSELARREEEILEFWNANNIFKKSEEKPAPKGEFVFYDGPPFATGLPHYGHILAGTIKDIIPRYRTMRGFRVRRRWGWDCHGLPLENEIEKELGLETKRDIEKLGIHTFNEAARAAVLRYADDWKRIVPRLGRWVDMERDYKTMDASYTESVWWIFKQLYDKRLIYQGFKSMHLCPRCGTTLSNFEVQQGYKDITDFAVTVKLPIEGEENTYLLVWTTTPWTLPGNMAAAVNKGKTYVRVDVEGEVYVIAKDRVEVLGVHPNIVEEFPGAKLVGKRYTPPFPYYKDAEIKGKEHAWKIYHAPYVSMEEGTGAVHLAPAFGEEDMELAKQEGIPLVHHVTEDGVFAEQVKDFAGMAVKPKDTKTEPEKHMAADIEIIKYLAHKNLLFKKEKIVHSYPLCWRCDTPLLNYAASSWFVKATNLRDELVSENRKIHWVPSEVGEKRFGNWLENVRDWAISRSRYWGAPLPVWRNEKTGDYKVIGSIAELKKHTKRSGNTYFMMRHGEAEHNVSHVTSSLPSNPHHLTEKGKRQVQAAARQLREHKIDFVYVSPLVRTKETAEIIINELNIPKDQVIVEDRLHENLGGAFEGRSIEKWYEYRNKLTVEEKLTDAYEGGESWLDIRKRMVSVLFDLEQKYNGKNVLIVSHGMPLRLMKWGAECVPETEMVRRWDKEGDIPTGSVQQIDFVPFPHNNECALDVHRPYIDEIELVDSDGEKLIRVPEVFDCWFESGSMPYAQYHYPFENTDVFDPKSGWLKKSKGYPADFIAEGMDQTRGWFYSLLVLGVGLFGKSPYQNVIVNGTVLAEDGQKMSKRLKNYPDPMDVVHRYGADSIRYYLLSSGVVHGDDFNFSEHGVAEISRKIVLRLSNVHSFYRLYASKETEHVVSDHVLDQWILVRLSELVSETTESMERYELDKATRPLMGFIDDLSTWYLRRSRDRYKGEGADAHAAVSTMRTALLECAKIMAPAMPFYAETLYRALRKDADAESVHLSAWPKQSAIGSGEKKLLADMKRVRELASAALEERTRTRIRVRQPLQTLTVKDESLKGKEALLALLRDEVNVKEIAFDQNIDSEVVLDTTITPQLKEEGTVRELVRHIQNLRKEAGLEPGDTATLAVSTDDKGRAFVETHSAELCDATTLSGVTFVDVSEESVTLGEYSLALALRRT